MEAKQMRRVLYALAASGALVIGASTSALACSQSGCGGGYQGGSSTGYSSGYQGGSSSGG
jgi:hypothetical protein